MAHHRDKGAPRSKKVNKRLVAKKLRQQRKKSDATSDSMYAAHRGYGAGRAKGLDGDEWETHTENFE